MKAARRDSINTLPAGGRERRDRRDQEEAREGCWEGLDRRVPSLSFVFGVFPGAPDQRRQLPPARLPP